MLKIHAFPSLESLRFETGAVVWFSSNVTMHVKCTCQFFKAQTFTALPGEMGPIIRMSSG